MVFETADVRQKLTEIEKAVALAFQKPFRQFPKDPARNAEILIPGLLPPKKGLSYREGQARLLHDLASIELQAMELGLRSLHEFAGEAPEDFRICLAEVTLSEARHLELCLNGIEELGFRWGDWPVHNMLWQSVASEDSLLDRVLIVHRYLEGSGLDAGDTLLRRLDSVLEGPLHKIVRIIVDEEIGHVDFGSQWYRRLCQSQKLDPQADFPLRLMKLKYRLPKRIEKISRELRFKAGFEHQEIEFLENLRAQSVKYPQKIKDHS